MVVYLTKFGQMGQWFSCPSGVIYLAKSRSMGFLFNWLVLIVNDFILFFTLWKKGVL